MRKTTITALLSVTMMLGSCGIYNKYERPDINTDGIIRDNIADAGTAEPADTASFGNLPWREVFTDPLLQNLIQQGMEHNVNMMNAALNVKMVEAQLSAAKLAFVPQFTFTPQATVSSWDFGKATQTYSLPVNASWTIDLFGNLLNQKRSAQMALLATKDYQLVVKTQVVSGIANLYYTLLMLDRQLEIINEMAVLTKDTWDVMKMQMELGRYRSTSVQSAEAAHYSVLAKAEDMKRQIRETENALSILIGQPAQTVERGKLADQSLPTEFATGVGLQLLANRADVHHAEMTLATCFYDVNTARSRFYPNITISGSGAYTNNGGGRIVNPGKILSSALASLVQPIFMNGQLKAGLVVAQAKYEQAYNNWQNMIFQAGSEVSNALVKYNSNAAKSELDAHQVEVLKLNVEHSKMLVSQSSSTYLEVIQAQSSLLNAEIAQITDDFNKMQAVVSLYQALGGGVR
ncbi:MAG: efflux transporter outer membrane subunit [Prevotella sp.]|uniref:efflux transporter outer membrane subunit n=1 Tax=Prevotella sp. TaxID=59823 RepID=UPI002A2FAD17|nr:efflux transporter outer membrane subunit [Prevotella sp.]MDD7317940.1 efflux transporter outer membrane subunit [Prevotellaceae bacterium]MDY4020831.1 efflux transporter outer membrane subunit [Prevotella sp.]